jgi:hypothetical protein
MNMQKRFIATGILLIVLSVCIAGCSYSPSSSTSTVATETTTIESNGAGTTSIVKTVPAVVSAPTETPSPIVLISDNSVMYPYGLEITVTAKNTANSKHSAFIKATCYKDNVDIIRMTVDATFDAYETRKLQISLPSKECAGGTYNVAVVGSSDNMYHTINVV